MTHSASYIGYLALAALAGLAAVALSDASGAVSWLILPVLAGAAAAFFERRAGSTDAQARRVGMAVGAVAFAASFVWLVIVVLTLGVA